MACYRCEICDNLTDDDWNPGTEYESGLICEDCATELEDLKETEKQEREDGRNE